MESDLQNLLPRIIIAFLFGIGAVMFFIIGTKRFTRFFMMDYPGNSKEKFKDNFVGTIYYALCIGCFTTAYFSYQVGLSWGLLPLSLCFGAFIIPVSILGAYWESYVAKKLWGGFMPIVREQYDNGIPAPQTQHKIDPSKIKIPRRTMISAFLIALLVFFGLYFLLYIIGWNGSVLSGIIFRLLFSGLMAFGIFMTIASASLSHRIQKLKDGEPLDDENDL